MTFLFSADDFNTCFPRVSSSVDGYNSNLNPLFELAKSSMFGQRSVCNVLHKNDKMLNVRATNCEVTLLCLSTCLPEYVL